ncbi:shikimate kinase AroL [Desulfobaculum xiamenense]|nr:shikimate kinase AroL [Desulfobaculum xiamenense]
MTFGNVPRPVDFGERTNVYLVGLRASGKTSLGRALAKRLGREFLDTDELVRQAAGRDVADIVAEGGWESFRRMEREALRGIAADAGAVVATGGGIVLDAENRAFMRAGGPVFYLMADVALLMSRLAVDPAEGQRPALTDLSPEDEMRATLAEREPLYLDAATFVLRAQDPLDELVEDVLDKLRLLRRG